MHTGIYVLLKKIKFVSNDETWLRLLYLKPD